MFRSTSQSFHFPRILKDILMNAKRLATKRPGIKLSPHEKRTLELLYLDKGVPRDQYKERPEELLELVDDFNHLTGRVDTADEILRYIINRQKNAQWVVFDGNHRTSPKHEELTADQSVSSGQKVSQNSGAS